MILGNLEKQGQLRLHIRVGWTFAQNPNDVLHRPTRNAYSASGQGEKEGAYKHDGGQIGVFVQE
jgi:hypothetical protein